MTQTNTAAPAATTPDEELTRLTHEKEKALLEKARAEADKARAEAQRAAAETRKATANLATPGTLAVEAARLAKDKAEADKAVAEAEKAALQAALPTVDTKPLDGKTTVDDNVTIGPQIQAHTALKAVAAEIASHLVSRTVIHSDRETALLAHLLSVSGQVAQLQARYDTLIPSNRAAAAVPTLMIPMVAGAALRSVGDVLALARADTEIKGKTIAIEEVALVAEIARHKPDLVVYPPLAVPRALATGAPPARIVRELRTLVDARNLAEQQILAFDAKPDAVKALDPMRDTIAALRALNTSTDRLLSQIATVDEKTGVNDLALLVRAELVADHLADTPDLLFVKILAAGGNNRTRRTLWGSQYVANGGCVVAYLLVGETGAIKASGVAQSLTDYAAERALSGSGH